MRLLTSCLLVVVVFLTPTIARANDAQDEYDRHFLGIGDNFSVTPKGYNLSKEPFEGENHRPVAFADFYQRVGRPDLATRYRHRRSLKIGLAVSGALVVVAGVIWLASQYVDNSDAFQSCVDHSSPITSPPDVCADAGTDRTGYIGGGLLSAIGLAGVIAGLAMPSQPVTVKQATDLADRYNEKLKKDLGLDKEQPDEPKQKLPWITLAPSVGPKGAGLRLTARF